MNLIRLNEKKLPEFLTTCVTQGDAFTLLLNVIRWLRGGKIKNARHRVQHLTALFRQNPELCHQIARLLGRWLLKMRLYPLFISIGIFSRNGFGSELIDRLYERFNPSYKDNSDLRDVFAQLFIGDDDHDWIQAVPERDWLKLFATLAAKLPENERISVQNYLRLEGFHAIEMLSIWVASEALDPDLVRIEPKLLDRDSPFVALKREIMPWVRTRLADTPYDDKHLYVMLDQCRSQVGHLRKKGTGAGAGSSLSVAHLLERLDQSLDRMLLLMNVCSPVHIPARSALCLLSTLSCAAAMQHSIANLWKRSVKMLSRSITQNTSDHGEHYITRTRKEYFKMFQSAALGGVLIALMSLHKIHLSHIIDNRFWLSIAEGLNYGLGFSLVFILGFTVATKQPAMTASRFAAAVDGNEKDTAVNMKLAQLLVDVFRSQTIAVFGNVFVAVSLASLIAASYTWYQHQPLLDAEGVAYQLEAINPKGATLWYAAIAGLWLFCSGIISGFFDNRCDYLNLKMRLRHHPLLKKILPHRLRQWFADYMHYNYGSIMGNLCFGMLLGMTGFIGYITGLPLDIRHVAFSSANVGYTLFSGEPSWLVLLQSLFFVLLIGAVNLIVSFSITLWVALRSREAKIDSWWNIAQCVFQIIQARPLSLIWPEKEEKIEKN